MATEVRFPGGCRQGTGEGAGVKARPKADADVRARRRGLPGISVARLRRSPVASVAVAASLLLVCVLVVSGCAHPTADPADWTTYHHDNSRAGLAPALAPFGTLSKAWKATLDGAVYGQPLVVGH